MYGQGYYPAFVKKRLCGAARASTRTERSRVARPSSGRLWAPPLITSESFTLNVKKGFIVIAEKRIHQSIILLMSI